MTGTPDFGARRSVRFRFVRIGLLMIWIAMFAVTPARADEGTPDDPPPPPVIEPTDIPEPEPTDIPPVPTDVPPPPTEVPPPPTDVPTEAPVPTDVPTEVPTEEPSPTPTPTPEPAIPFDPVLDCTLIDGGVLAVAGETTWSYQDCTVTWQTENVSAVELAAWSDAAGWQVIAVDLDDLNDPDAIAVADGTLDLPDSDLNDDGFFTSRFFVGTQLGCTSATSASINLQLTATSTAPVPEDENGDPILIENEAGELEQVPPGETVTETTLDDLTIDATSAAAPVVSIDSASFGTIDLGDGATSTSGTFSFSYSGAPQACDWQVTISIGDFVSASGVIPVSGLELTGVQGIDMSSVTTDVGTFVVAPPPGDVESGSFTLEVQLVLDGVVPEGEYTATITMSTQVNS